MSVGAVILFVIMLAIIGVLVSALGERDAEIYRMRHDILGKRVVGKSPWADIPPLCGRQAGPRIAVGEPMPRPKWPRPPSGAIKVSPSALGPVGTPGKGNPFFDPGRPPSAGSSMTLPPPLRLEVTP